MTTCNRCHPGRRGATIRDPGAACRRRSADAEWRAMRDHVYWVYILASRRNGTLYTGVTSDLTGRVQAHREGLIAGFNKKYGVKLLVYYELHRDINVAILSATGITRRNRKWK